MENTGNAFNSFMHTNEKCSNLLKNIAVRTSQDFKSLIDHFLSLCLRGLMNDKIELILEKVVGCVTAYCLMLTEQLKSGCKMLSS